MKNTIYKLSFLVFVFIFVASCDNGFDELNTDETNATSLDPAFILNRAIINSAQSTLVYEIGAVQWIVTPFSGVLTGANYNQDNRESTDDDWVNYYDVIQHTRDVIHFTQDVPERSNLMNMARIIQSWAFMVLTDTYGAIPYNDGGNGYYSQDYFPEYQSQAEIYPQLIAEMTDAANSLNASGRIETADILYGGNIGQWKKFGYSLLLRMGMRLSEVDPTQAASVVQTAFNGGVITSNQDNAVIRHTQDYRNPVGNTLNSTEGANFYLTKTFVDRLKSLNDPRLAAFSVRYVGAASGNDQKPQNISTAVEDQIGMPMGFDNGTIETRAKEDGLVSMYDYSQADRNGVASVIAPSYIVTAGQTNLLLAEARFRGWITQGTAEQYYENGIRTSLEQVASYDSKNPVSEDEIDAYIAAHPLNTGTELQQINTQYWISSFLNGEEGWANFRRSGYPDLEANPYPGRETTWINRLTYPNSEIQVNSANVNAAIAEQGPDDLETKVWWDK